MKKILLVVCMVFFVSLNCTASDTNSKAIKDFKPDSNMGRSQVPNSYKWNAGSLFASDDFWQKGYDQVKSSMNSLSQFKGKLGELNGLKNCMKQYFDTRLIFDKVVMYSNLKNVEDDEIEKYQQMRKKAVALAGEFNGATSFIREELISMKEAEASKLLSDPSMKEYKDYLLDLRRRKAALLDPQAEKVLTIMGDNLWAEIDLNDLPSSVEMIFKAVMRDIQLPEITDEEGKKVQLTMSNYPKYRGSKNRKVRKEAVTAFFGALKDYQNIFAATLGAEFERDVALAKARGYKRAIDAYLDMQNIKADVVENLINTIHNNLEPLHKYVELRKKILDLPDVHIYDLYTSIVPSIDLDIPYDEAKRDIIAAVKPLGDDYIKVLSQGLDPKNGWVDIYPNKGKESGAFCIASWRVHPYVKMNYQNNINDASTLAHEFGHALHYYNNYKAQDYPNFGFATLIAEIPSTTNEVFLSKYLMEKYKDDQKMQLYLLGEQIETIRTTIYRQTLFAEFEVLIHKYIEEGTPITAELMNKTYKDLIRKYYGPNFVIDKNDDIEWAYIPHFFWKFYVYSYAAALSSGIAMADNIIAEGDVGRDRYMTMLRASVNDNPVEVIKKAGVDLLKPTAIEAAAKMMSDAIDKMEKIVSKSKQQAVNQ